jgi:hypothetical protein
MARAALPLNAIDARDPSGRLRRECAASLAWTLLLFGN